MDVMTHVSCKSRLCCLLGVLLLLPFVAIAQKTGNRVVSSADGWRFFVQDKPVMINGMNWDYSPIGTTYSYDFWGQPDAFVQQALDTEMGLLKSIGVNAIRVYTGIPKKWITYIYEKHGIFTMLNHSFGRYGLTLDGAWVANTEYGDPRVQAILLKETRELAAAYKDTPGLLLYLLGNENNYGLFWEGAETENIPVQDRKSTKKAISLYRLFNQAVLAMKKEDASHPVAICNGDLLFLDVLKTETPDVDIFGVNVYRGVSFTDLFDRVKKDFNKPLLLTEFGSDAFNVKTGKEDQLAQALYKRENWKEVYANAAGMGKAGNAIGGFTFQFSDGWWKTGQTYNLTVHDTTASWSNGGYQFDFTLGKNNMNEEWFGVTSKGPSDSKGFYSVYPRAAFYVLQQVHRYNPYAPSANARDLNRFFDSISLDEAFKKAQK